MLDEPTSSLDADEVEELFRVIRSLKESGVAIVFVSHFLDQVYEISDRLTVLRNGRLVGDYRTDELLRIELVHKMIGKEMAVLEQIERRTQAAERRPRSSTPCVQAVGLGPQGLDRADRPRRSTRARWSAWPACSARAAPSWAASSPAWIGPTAATLTVARPDPALPHPRGPP